jgi:aldose 1-epimerase
MFDGVTHELPLTEPARHNAIHGLVNWLVWRPIAATADSVRVATDIAPQPGYPWRLHLEVTWSISASGLRSEAEATNESDTRCPFGFSVHPYLQVPGTAVDDLVLRVPARSRLLVDGRLLPIGAARVAGSEFDYTQGRRIASSILDTAFGELERTDGEATEVTLSTVDGAGVKMWADPAFGWWQVFTSDTLPGDRRRRSVAVEPMTCPPDAFRSGRDLIVLEPGQTWSGAWGITTL